MSLSNLTSPNPKSWMDIQFDNVISENCKGATYVPTVSEILPAGATGSVFNATYQKINNIVIVYLSGLYAANGAGANSF